MSDFGLAVAFWIAIAMAIGGTAAALTIAWLQWKSQELSRLRSKAIRAAIRTGLAP
jgi:hypothetical protein